MQGVGRGACRDGSKNRSILGSVSEVHKEMSFNRRKIRKGWLYKAHPSLLLMWLKSISLCNIICMEGRKQACWLIYLWSCRAVNLRLKQTNTTKTKQKVWNHFCSIFDVNPRKLCTKPACQVLSKFLLFISLPRLQTAPSTSKLFSFFQEGSEGNTPKSPSHDGSVH